MKSRKQNGNLPHMKTLNEKLIQSVKDSIFCELVDYGTPVGEAYELSHVDIDPVEVMENVSFEGASF